MKRFRTVTTLSIATAIGFSALMLTACNEAAPPPGETTGTGGNEVSNTDGNGVGGSSAKSTSSKTGKGGSTAKTSANKAQGGADATSDEEGGAGGADEGTGGTSQVSKTTKSTNKGGSSSTSGKAAGGKSGTGGASTKSAGSSSSSKGGASSTTANSSTSTSASACTTDEEKKFSFFLASHAALTKLSGSPDGFGGKLGGLTGADKICQEIAETSAPCHKGTVVWHAFLSTSSENAKDRIGKGPWYDRKGRTLAMNMTDLLQERPKGADSAIVNDFPNENGVPNHNPDGTGDVDNHEILTGTGTDGKVYTQSASSGGGGLPGGIPGFATSTSCGPNNEETWDVDRATCWGWTTNEEKGCPRVGHSWPRQGSGVGWISVWNEGGCAPGGVLTDDVAMGGLDGTRRVGSAGGYGGFYCFAVTGE